MPEPSIVDTMLKMVVRSVAPRVSCSGRVRPIVFGAPASLCSSVSSIWVEDDYQSTDPDPIIALQRTASMLTRDADAIEQELVVVQ